MHNTHTHTERHTQNTILLAYSQITSKWKREWQKFRTRAENRTAKRDLEIVRRDATTVVDNLEGFSAIVFERNLDAGGAGVQAVLNQLLDGGGKVQNNLTSTNSMHDALVYGLYSRRWSCWSSVHFNGAQLQGNAGTCKVSNRLHAENLGMHICNFLSF